MTTVGVLFVLLLVLLGAILVVRLRYPLPSLDGRSHSVAFTNTYDTPLGRAVAPLIAEHPGLSGIFPLTDGRSGLAARVHLVRAARRSLDLQYYIWHADLSGSLLFEEVGKAADRGVRVRLLLDDNSTSGLDPTLRALDAHPNIEVRLFNPFVLRFPRFVGYLTDFPRLNRRMHNKSFTADNQAVVIGGRNVGDEYFEAGEGTSFVDLDLLAIGPVVADVSASFDRYWASASSYPASRILARRKATADTAAVVDGTSRDPRAEPYIRAVAQSDYAQALLEYRLRFEWAATRMAADDPAKGLGKARPEALLWSKLTVLLGEPKHKLQLVSAYFVPTAAGVDAFARLARQGVDITILTNALEATDVPVVHAGYAKWRMRMLKAGIRLYEMGRLAEADGVSRRLTALGSTGSGARGAGSALHAKTFAIDGARVFVGSFNFDPRSAKLNTELGFIVDSPSLAGRMEKSLAQFLSRQAFRVELSDRNELRWVEQVGGRRVVHDTEPGTNWRQRAALALLSCMPIEWLL